MKLRILVALLISAISFGEEARPCQPLTIPALHRGNVPPHSIQTDHGLIKVGHACPSGCDQAVVSVHVSLGVDLDALGEATIYATDVDDGSYCPTNGIVYWTLEVLGGDSASGANPSVTVTCTDYNAEPVGSAYLSLTGWCYNIETFPQYEACGDQAFSVVTLNDAYSACGG